MRRYYFEIVAFISGAVVMILELTGSRILAPYVGSSIFVWSSLIGIVLASLSLGYYWGGRLADKNATTEALGTIIFSAGLFIGTSAFFEKPFLDFLSLQINDIRIAAIVSSLILFAPPNVLLGMVLPFAVRLRLRNLKTSGKTAGNLFAISTIGSIVGTFAAGFFLIAFLGSTRILTLLSVLLLSCSFLAFIDKLSVVKTSLIFLLAATIFAIEAVRDPVRPGVLIDKDTAYSRVIIDIDANESGRILRMFTGRTFQAAMSLENEEALVFASTRFYRLAGHFQPEIKRALMIGGGGYSYPKDFLRRFPHAQLDVVEIDPEITVLARKYFKLADSSRLTVYHQDGRVFLNTNMTKYDAVILDAYLDGIAIPFQLTTVEAVKRIYDSLNDGGVTIVNIIEGDELKFLRAEIATYKAIFPQVFLFPISYPNDIHRLQNFALIALKSKEKPKFESEDDELNEYLGHLWNGDLPLDMPILTDNYAPVEQYLIGLQNTM